MDEGRFSNLTHLVKTVAQVRRAAKCFAAQNRILGTSKWEAVSSAGVFTVTEHQDALRDLFLAAQEGVTFPTTTTDRLVVYKEEETGLLVCGGRIQAFNEDRVSVPLLQHLGLNIVGSGSSQHGSRGSGCNPTESEEESMGHQRTENCSKSH